MAKYSEQQINAQNQSMRGNQDVRSFLSSIGADPNGPLKLSDQQRKQTEDFARSKGLGMDGLQIDPAGNWNQDEGWSKHKKWAIPAAIGASMLIPGVGPALMAGMKATGSAVGGALGL